ncbi:hypothetical protein [Celerinatantimonas sp. YJH-8]|uniref:hypothetical protein n=1 Tax=Celerinatantimonas sp. YJH-8 TaxID=3228714 RepID=UPI0038C06AAA
MADILVAVGLLIFEIVLFFWCCFIKRRFLNLGFILKTLSWINWVYWLMFNMIIWQDFRFIFPYDLISGRDQADGISAMVAFIFSFILFFQGPIAVYLNRRRRF